MLNKPSKPDLLDVLESIIKLEQKTLLLESKLTELLLKVKKNEPETDKKAVEDKKLDKKQSSC